MYTFYLYIKQLYLSEDVGKKELHYFWIMFIFALSKYYSIDVIINTNI